MTDVAAERLEPRHATLFAHGLLHRGHAAGARDHAPPCLLGRGPGGQLVVELQGREALELFAQLGVVPITLEQAGQAPRCHAQGLHASPPSARKRAMIAVVCAQSRDARAISARPPRVSR